ncbi:MAG: hypothetical protein V4569_09410 [Pseudomonadota bacterium]
MLKSFGLEDAIRVSPLHSNSEADVDRFLEVTREITASSAPAVRHYCRAVVLCESFGGGVGGGVTSAPMTLPATATMSSDIRN